MNISTFKLEKELAEQGYDFIIGVDEAGRGPLCGPVVAAAAVRKSQNPNLKSQTNSNDQSLNIQNEESTQDTRYKIQDDDEMWDLVRDSKKLSEKQREKVFDFIHKNFYVGVGLCNHETIDRINILEASFLAMKKSVQELTRIMNQELRINDGNSNSMIHDSRFLILVDGNKTIPNFSMEQRAIIGGDGSVKSIAAASIIAKVTRDRLMMEMHKKYPQYGFDKHKGYGTKLHMEMLAKYGPSEIHRKSFAPVTRLLKKTN